MLLAMSSGVLVSLSMYDGSGAGSAHSALCSVSSIIIAAKDRELEHDTKRA